MGKARSKPKRYRTDREGASPARRKYIEQVSNPRSPEDLVLALQNPSSPAYKEMMNQLNAKVENIAIIEMLIQHRLIDKEMATQREKDEVEKVQIAHDVMNQQKEAIRYNEQAIMANQHRTPLKEEEPMLRKEIEQRKEAIRNLDTKIHVVSATIDTLKTEAKKIDNNWNDIIDNQRKNYYDLMKDVSLYKADGTEIKPGSDEHRRMLLRDMDRKDDSDQYESIVNKMGIVAASMMLHEIQSAMKPAGDEPKLDAREVVKNINTDEVAEKVESAGNVNDQFKEFVELAGEEPNPSAILAAIRKNKEANRIKAEQLAKQKESPEGQKKTQCVKDALNNRKELMINRGELLDLERDKQQNITQLAKDEKIYKDRFGMTPSAAQNVVLEDEPGHAKRK